MSRYFTKCKDFVNEEFDLPHRSTKNAAGYDFYAPQDITIPSIWSTIWKMIRRKAVTPTMVKTHVKAKMRANEVLFLYNRSSNPKKGLILANSVGVVDADYFSNKDNDGDIGFGFYNVMPWPVTIKKGQKIGQGVFGTFLKTDSDTPSKNVREGGFGSTGE